MLSVPDRLDSTHHRGHTLLEALHVQLVTEIVHTPSYI